MAVTRTTKKGTTTFDFKPVKLVTALGVAITLYELYKLVEGQPRIRVVADPDMISKVNTLTTYDGWNMTYELLPLNIRSDGNEMKYQMTGVGFSDTMDPWYRKIMTVYTYNDLRLLHNYWIRYLDNDLSIYDWIEAESASDNTLKKKVLNKLGMAGVGFKNVVKIPKEDYLLI